MQVTLTLAPLKFRQVNASMTHITYLTAMAALRDPTIPAVQAEHHV